MTHIIDILFRKSHDKIHIDVVKAKTSGQFKAFDRLVNGMMTSDNIQCLLLHRLRIDGDTADSVITQHLKLLLRDGIRSSCLYGKFDTMAKIKAAADLADQTVKLIRFQRRRCTSADIDGVQLLVIILRCHIIEFLLQSIQIRIHLISP